MVSNDPDLETTEAIYDALDSGDPERALALARAAAAEATGQDPVLAFLCGRALMELERPLEAAQELERALTLDGDDAEFRAYAAWALFRGCRFERAGELIAEGTADERLAEWHYVTALLAERRGELEEADLGFGRAAELEPEWFLKPVRFSAAEFDEVLSAARQALPDVFRKHLDRVDVIVDDLPPEALLSETDPPLDPEQLLGLFSGLALDQESSFSPGGELPPRIFLFKRNLERFVCEREELSEQIRVTLFHELGHYLGMDEDDLEKLGYG